MCFTLFPGPLKHSNSKEMMLPGLLRWLKSVNAQVVVCCPLMNREACWGAQITGIPCVGLMTTAGPGSMAYAMKDFLEKMGLTIEGCLEHRKNYQPLQECFERLRSTCPGWPMVSTTDEMARVCKQTPSGVTNLKNIGSNCFATNIYWTQAAPSSRKTGITQKGD